MKYYKLFLFLLLTIMDVSTNAQEVTCEGEQLLNVDVLMGHPGIVSPYKPGHILVFRCTDVNMKMYGQRTIECLSNGKWDNPYPKCGAVKCPAIRTNAFVNASGNTEEGSYGDVIHFECVSADKKIDGSSDIHCTETGEWSDSVPTCKEITCTAPHISNGVVVEPEEEYQKDAILKYRCSPGFKAREGIPKCAKFGWTLNPECDDVTCELKSTRFGVQKINPGGKTIFRAGESVEITCTEKYWIFGTKEFIKSFTCQENGEWDHPPVCQGKCGPPPHVNFADTTEMTKREYNSGERVEYSCFNKYILDQRHPYSKYLTCEDGEWRGNIKCLKPCSVSVELMDERGVELRWGGRQKIFSPNGDKITFICQRGKSSIGIDLKQTYSNKTALVRGGHSRSQRVKVLPYFYLIH